MPAITVTHLTKTFQQKGQTVEALKDISLTIETGDIYGIIGMSGAGKSTLVRCFNYLEKPTSGEVCVEGKNLGTLNEKQLRTERTNIAMIFQHFNLLMQKSVLDNVCFPMQLQRKKKKETRQRAMELLKTVGLEEKANAYPAQLSGGQKQRVAIARALAMDPKVMLLDEPTSALDPELVGEVLSVIRDLADGGMTMIMATHQMDFARALATDILFMEQGKIIEQGAPDVLLAPGSGTRTSDFCGKLFDLRGTEKSDEPTVSELLTGDLSHDITDDGSESSMIPDAPKKD